MSSFIDVVSQLLSDELENATGGAPPHKYLERIQCLTAALRDLTQVQAVTQAEAPSAPDPLAVVQDHTDLLILRDVLTMVTPGAVAPEVYRRVQGMSERLGSMA